MRRDEEFRLVVKIVFSLVSILALIAMLIVLCCSCTISFQNISTHGPTDHVIDENLTTDPNVDPNLSIPLMGD